MPLLEAASGDDTFLEQAVATAIEWSRNTAILGLDTLAPFSTEIPSVQQAVIQLITEYYNNAFKRCIAPDGERLVEGGKMIRARRNFELLGVNVASALPNFNVQIEACLVGPLRLRFDSTIKDSLATAGKDVLDTTFHVLADAVSLTLNATNPDAIFYDNTGATLEYVSFDGTIHWPPGTSDCGSQFVGSNGTMVAAAAFDLNIFDFAKPLDVKMQVFIDPQVSETITAASIPPMGICNFEPPAAFQLYVLGFSIAKGAAQIGSPFPYEVDLNAPKTFNLSGSLSPVTASETTTITLSQQNP